MSLHDNRGNPVSAATPAALAHYERAADLFLGFSAKAADAAEAAVAADPGFVMGHCLQAGLAAIANEKTFEPQARPAVEAAERLAAGANRRERGHIAALRAFLDGEWRKANAIYGEILIDHPRDTLALQIAHALDFYLGQSALLRDRIARVLPHWGAAGARLRLRARHARLRPRGDGRLRPRRKRRPRGGQPEPRRRLGDPRGRARDGDAGPFARRHRLARGTRRRLGRGRQPVRDPQRVASRALPPRPRRARPGARAVRRADPRRQLDRRARPRRRVGDAVAAPSPRRRRRARAGTSSSTPGRRRSTAAGTRSTTSTR